MALEAAASEDLRIENRVQTESCGGISDSWNVDGGLDRVFFSTRRPYRTSRRSTLLTACSMPSVRWSLKHEGTNSLESAIVRPVAKRPLRFRQSVATCRSSNLDLPLLDEPSPSRGEVDTSESKVFSRAAGCDCRHKEEAGAHAPRMITGRISGPQ
eukprot:1375861-Amorphochlora_amoeboformis.AAC.2